jgi:diguanylate cyclase (GGDEF)-like protein
VLRPSTTPRPGSALRLFLVFAVVSLIPVLLLGLVLAASYRSDAAARGLAEGRAQAGLFAHIAVEPLLADADLTRPLTAQEVAGLDRMSQSAVDGGEIVRLRVRDLTGRIVYSSDGSGDLDEVDDEALEAAEGEIVAEVTHLDADDNGGGTGDVGIRAAEVYRPLTDGTSTTPIGVLELYLPYDPIAQDVEAGLDSLYRDLAVGLTLLYVLLAGISWSATRRLRSQVARNAFLAEHDQLTGLPNRTAFQKRLDEAIAAAGHGGPAVAVAILDLDRFKEVNETLGHGNGDALLRQLGQRLSAAVRAEDFVARLGGDEFGIILVLSQASALSETVARVQRVMGREIELAGLPLVVEASIGIALAPEDGSDAETLLQHADVAMYVAKQAGSGVARYHKELDQYDAARLALVGEMRRALAGGELLLHFQPKLDLRTGAVEAVEALVRWNHPERGLLMPDRFLPVVEKTGMIDPMTAWVVDAALSWASAPQAPALIRVAVNVSARNLENAGFPDVVLAALSRHGVTPDRLAIEVTETALVADLQRAELSLRRLAAAGVRVSVDDFGRGQTSLSQLSTLPLHEVKIDKSFVTDMGEVASNAAIVRSVVDLAHNLGFEVVAEGVETESVLDALRLAGCDIAQGYHIARPMPAEKLEKWLLAQGSADLHA